MFTNPGRNQATHSVGTRQNRPTQAGAVAAAAEIVAGQIYQANLATYEAEVERVKFDQTTLDMQYKASLTDYEKRKTVYVRNITRA